MLFRSRPFRGNVLVFRNRLVKVKRRLRLCNVPVFIRYIPALQRVTAPERAGNNAACGITGVGGNFLHDVRTNTIDRTAVQVEGSPPR